MNREYIVYVDDELVAQDLAETVEVFHSGTKAHVVSTAATPVSELLSAVDAGAFLFIGAAYEQYLREDVVGTLAANSNQICLVGKDVPMGADPASVVSSLPAPFSTDMVDAVLTDANAAWHPPRLASHEETPEPTGENADQTGAGVAR